MYQAFQSLSYLILTTPPPVGVVISLSEWKVSELALATWPVQERQDWSDSNVCALLLLPNKGGQKARPQSHRKDWCSHGLG